jgi:putative endonuclease
MPFTYILKCADDSYYIGSTRDLEHRVWQHSTGQGSAYTSRRMPVTLVFAQEFDRIDDAYALEKRMQGWSRRKREAVIEGRFNDLPALSKKVFPPKAE